MTRNLKILFSLLLLSAALAISGAVGHAATVVAQFVYGVRYDKQASKPSNCTTGRVCDWVDTNGKKHFWNGTADQTFPLVTPTAKGDIIAYTGTAWDKKAVGTNGYCLKADSTTTTGLVWATCGGGSGTLQDGYNNSSNPVTITEDNTRGGVVFKANSNGDSPIIVKNNAGSLVAHFDADGALETRYHYTTSTATDALQFEAATANSGSNNAFQFNNTTNLTGSTTLATFGSNSVVKAKIYNDGTYLAPGATLTRDSLATTTATSVLLRNTTASTGGATVQVSPALAFEGASYVGSNQNTGARLYHDTATGGPYLTVGFKTDSVASGAYVNYGRMFPGYGYAGFSIGDSAGVNWLDFGGGASGAGAIRVVANGASHSVFDATGFYPYGSGYAVGTAANYFYSSAFRHPGGGGSAPTCSVGAALGSGSPSCSISGTDAAYEVTITTGSSGAGTGTMVTITASAAWGATAHCVMTPTTSGSGTALYAVYYDRAGSSTTTQVWGTQNALTNGSTYKFDVLCVQ